MRATRGSSRAFAAAVVSLVGAFIGALVPGTPADAAPDTTAPNVEGLALTPGSLSTNAAPGLVTATIRITDDLGGLSIGGTVPLTEIRLTGPTGQQVAKGWFSQANRISGNPLDGTYRTVITIPQLSEPGAWTASVMTYDQAANTQTYTAAQLAASGFSNTVNQTGAGDTVAPSVVAFSVSPTTIDTSLTNQTLTFSVRITDDASGVSAGTTAAPSQITMRGPTGSHTVSTTFGTAQRVSGSSLDGVYASSTTIPRWSEQGVWTVQSLVVRDNVGNARTLLAPDLVGATFQTMFTQTGPGDIVSPRFRAFTITPSSVDTSTGAALLVFRARLTDDISGVAMGVADTPSEALFRSPSGDQEVIAQFGSQQRTSGTQFDGWYEYAVTLPPGSEQGIWTLVYARPVDAAHNASTMNATEWAASGFPVSLEVRSDGTPSAPRSVNAIKNGTAGATVSWLTPSVTGSSAITGYTITATPSGRTLDVGATASNGTITGLANGVTYTFQVQARNAAGPGSISAASNAVTIGDIPDLAAPNLSALSLTPVVVQTTSGPASVTIDVGVTDDASGPTEEAGQLSAITFTPPSGAGAKTVTFGPQQLLSGTPTSGAYRTQLALAQGSEQGAWTITSIVLRDVAGHARTITTAQLVAAGRPSVVVVQSATAPSAPMAVSAAAGNASATVSWLPPSSDGGAPITGYLVTSSPGNKTATVGTGITSAIVTTLTNGTPYTFTVKAINAVGTGPASAPSNQVTPGGTDLVVPTLASFTIAPMQLSGSATTQAVTVTARITDAGSGVADAAPLSSVSFAQPDGTPAGTLDFGPIQRISGTIFDGTYQADLIVPANPAAGTWPVVSVIVRDRAGNQLTIPPSQLAAVGYPTSFSVDDQRLPGAPTNASATAGFASATVSWLPPADEGSTPVVSYTVTSVPGGQSTTVPATETTAVVNGLTNGVPHVFVVVATNASGDGPTSAPSNAVTPGGPDTGAPVFVTLAVNPPTLETQSGAKTVTVTVQATDGVSGLTDTAPRSSLLIRSPSGSETTIEFGAAQRTAGTPTDGTYAIAIALPQNAEQGAWTFAGLVLRDAAGNQSAVAEADIATAGFPTGFTVTAALAPGAPTNVECRWTGSAIYVSWARPVDGGSSPITTYTVTASPGGAVQTTGATHASYTTLRSGRAYSFTVRATNGTGTGPASAASALCTVGLDTGSTGNPIRPADRPVGGILDDAKDKLPTR